MYEETTYLPLHLGRLTLRRWVRVLFAVFRGCILALAFIGFCALASCVCTGCSAPGDYFGDKPAVAAANAAPGGFGGITATAPALVVGAVRSAGWLNGLGAVALLAGCVVLSQRDLNNGLGFGLVLGGLALLLAGFLLPVYGGWIGLGLLAALGAFYWRRVRSPLPADSAGHPDLSLTDRLKTLFT